MVLINRGPIKEGDWVSGTSAKDERFIGYVDSMDENGALKVRVTQCDHETIVGTIIGAKLGRVRKLPESQPSSPLELQGLIEIALSTYDKEWFDALGVKLNALPATEGIWPSNTKLIQVRGSRL